MNNGYVTTEELRKRIEVNVILGENKEKIAKMTDEAVDILIDTASMILDVAFPYIGEKTDSKQAHEFPRNGEIEVPFKVQTATIYIVNEIIKGTHFSIIDRSIKQETQSEKVDVIETHYYESKDKDIQRANVSEHPFLFATMNSYIAKDYLKNNKGFSTIHIQRV